MRGNPDKLKPVRTKQEASERGKNGGIKSGEARRRKKAEKDFLKMILELPISDSGAKEKLSEMGISEEYFNNEMYVAFSLFKLAAKGGDLNAIKYIDERMGKNPQLELKRQIFEKDAEIKRLNAELAQRKHNVNRQRLKGEYDVDLESGLIEDSNDNDEGGLE